MEVFLCAKPLKPPCHVVIVVCSLVASDTHKLLWFSSDGSFVLGSTFELLFSIRPRSPTGLLLHVGESSRSPSGGGTGHYLSVYMLRGEVRLQPLTKTAAPTLLGGII